MNDFRVSQSKLADGRELFYFYDRDSVVPSEMKPDRRSWTERPPTAQMRQDPLTREWVSIAATRGNRAFLPPASSCPLCPANDENLSEVPGFFDVAVFENKNPSFGPDLASSIVTGAESHPDETRLGKTRPAIGRCEVVIFSPEHEGSVSNLSITRVRTIIEAFAVRTEQLMLIDGVKQVFAFENRGEAIGVTLHHPHGQIYAYPFVTPRTQKVLDSIALDSGNLFSEILAFEESSERVLLKTNHFVAYVPFAARWPIEIHLLPMRHVQNLSELSSEERDDLAVVYSRLLGAVDRLYDTPTPYIAAWHQAPVGDSGKNVRLQLQITSPRRAADRLKYLAGSEAAMGAFIADFAAETIADRLREALL